VASTTVSLIVLFGAAFHPQATALINAGCPGWIVSLEKSANQFLDESFWSFHVESTASKGPSHVISIEKY